MGKQPGLDLTGANFIVQQQGSDLTGSTFREQQQGAKQVEQTVVPLNTCSQGQHGNGYNKLSSESFEQSKKDALNLVTSKIEKFTKDDKNRQGLKCSFKGCYFTTSATLKKCKARKQMKNLRDLCLFLALNGA